MEGCGSKNHKHSDTRKSIPGTSPFHGSAELGIISNSSRDGRNVVQHLPRGLSTSTFSAGPCGARVPRKGWQAWACCRRPRCNGFMGLNSRKQIVGERTAMLWTICGVKDYLPWVTVAGIAPMGPVGTLDGGCSAWWPTATAAVTAQWQPCAGRCSGRDTFAAIRGLLQSPGGVGLFYCLLGGLLHQKGEDIKCLIHAQLQKQSNAAGVRFTPLLPSLPARCLPALLSLPKACPGLLRALHLSPQVPHLHKPPVQGRAVAVPFLCQEHLMAWSTTCLVASRQGAALGTPRTREWLGCGWLPC